MAILVSEEKTMSILKKVKVLWQLLKLGKGVKAMTEKVEEGAKTSEFKLAAAAGIVLSIFAILKIIRPETAAILLTIITANYGWLREHAKRTKTTLDDKIVEIIEKLLNANKEE